MIEETLIVSDSNIFFDLLSVDLLGKFFKLPCRIATTDFVISEIERPEQLQKLQTFIYSKKLEIAVFEIDDLDKINELYKNRINNVSFTDCSVWHYAKEKKGRLLTGDGKLRSSAENDNVKVSGVLYIFDNFIEYGILTANYCAKKLEQLMKLNTRLPKGECEKRVAKWKNSSKTKMV